MALAPNQLHSTPQHFWPPSHPSSHPQVQPTNLRPAPKTSHKPNEQNITYLQILIRSLLVLLVHRIRCRSCKGTNGSEDGEGNTNTDGRVRSHFPALAWWRQGTRTMGAEGDVVCCEEARQLLLGKLKVSLAARFRGVASPSLFRALRPRDGEVEEERL